MEWPFVDYEQLELVRPDPGTGPVGCRAGQLWRARRRIDNAAVALKVFADRAWAEREAELARAIDHRHVLAAEEVITGGSLSALVLPDAQRGSLAALLGARHRLNWPEALTVLIPVADALAAAHERDLVHGDLSCSNIVIDAVGRPLVIDFGAARAAIEAGTPVAATPTDVAPEIVRGAAPGPSTDLFSLGSIALRCLTGRSAWPADSLEEVLVQSAAGQWPDIDDNMAPPRLCALVRRLLDADPEARGSAGELAVSLRSIGRPEPIRHATGFDELPATEVRPDALRPPADLGTVLVGRAERAERRRPGRYHPVLLGSAAAVLVCAVAVGWWWPSAQPTEPTQSGLFASSTELTAAAPPSPVSATIAPPMSVISPAMGEEVEEEPDWFAVVAGLDRARARALADLDPGQLSQVYLAGAEGYAADTATIADLLRRELRPAPVRHQVISVEYVGLQPDGAVVVEVTATLPSVTIRDGSGAMIARTAAGSRTTSQLSLAETAAGYRIDGIWPGST